MGKIIRHFGLCVLMAAALACAGRGAVQTGDQPQAGELEYTGNSLSLDAALDEAASYFAGRLPTNAKVAVIPFDAPTGRLSDYILEELWSRFEDSKKFVLVDRRNLDRIEAEIKHQLESGRVDDYLTVSVTKQYGAEILVYGQIVSMGGEYRMAIYATDVEKAVSSQRAFNVRPDSRLAALLDSSAEDEVERAVSVMARSLDRRTTIAVGRISYANTQTVSGLSAWLKNRLISSAQKHQDKFQVASEDESAEFAVASRGLTVEAPGGESTIQAVIIGNYLPLDDGAEVTLQLVSTGGNRLVLASSQFEIPAAELERRRLSLLPEQDNMAISLPDFEAKQEVLDSYSGKNNRWAFTVTPGVLDGIYYDGEFMFMCVYSAHDCYFRIIHIDVNGSTQVIYPVAANDNNFIQAGETRMIPDNTLYKMGPPFGEEIILVAAYEEPFTVSQLSDAEPLSEETITRSFTVEDDNNAPMAPSATAKFSYTILPK